MSDSLTAHFGVELFIRLGPTVEPYDVSIVLEVFAPNTMTAPLHLEADEQQLYLTLGDANDCAMFEKHLLDADAFDWAVGRIVTAGEQGIQMWRDSRRPLFGGQHYAAIVGDPFVDVSDKRRARLTLAVVTEPWTVPGGTLGVDPVAWPDRHGSVFLVDANLPKSLVDIATSARQQFGSAISIVTRMDALGGTKALEILPIDRDATRMRIKKLDSEFVGLSTGEYQYSEYEFTPVPTPEAMERVLQIGHFGLMETDVRRGVVHWFVNGPATAEAVDTANRNPRAEIQKLWNPWAQGQE